MSIVDKVVHVLRMNMYEYEQSFPEYEHGRIRARLYAQLIQIVRTTLKVVRTAYLRSACGDCNLCLYSYMFIRLYEHEQRLQPPHAE